jgi:hypothetical protein
MTVRLSPGEIKRVQENFTNTVLPAFLRRQGHAAGQAGGRIVLEGRVGGGLAYGSLAGEMRRKAKLASVKFSRYW